MSESTVKSTGKHWETIAPIATLIFISPVFTELLVGMLHLSNLWLLIPEMSVYGTAALIIREVTRRQKRGWGTMLLLGIAFAIAEECLILQTSLTPQFFPPAFEGNFGWVYGVQWIYLIAMLWFESVYAIVLPIYLTEMLFPAKRNKPWLTQHGLVIAIGIFVLASIGVWELWSQIGLQSYGPSTYQIPPLYLGVAFTSMLLLITGTLLIGHSPNSLKKVKRRAPRPWLVWLMAFGFGLAWFYLIALAFVPATTVNGASPAGPIGMGLAWITLGLLVLRYISSAGDWGDRHRLALIFGASVASMIGGVIVVLTASPIDIIGKFVFDLIAVGLFFFFGARIRKRSNVLQSKWPERVEPFA